MNSKIIAIYSGDIPSTTFIENLIKSVAGDEYRIYIFGIKKREVRYNNKNILVFNNPGKSWKIFPFVWFNKLRIILSSFKNYTKLREHINSKSKTTLQRYLLWSKYLPVIIHMPDLFHIQWAKSVDEWMFLKNIFGVKMVLSLRGAQINYSPLADLQLADSYRKNFPVIDGFHAVSKDIAKNAMKYKASENKIKVIYSGFDTSDFKPKGKFQHSKNRPLQILSVGRFHWIKGYHYAVEAMNRLKSMNIAFHYTIISNGGDGEEIMYRINELNLSDSVSILGSMPHKEVLKKISDADMLLLPSVEEGIANVVLEAMACGTVVLSSNCSGMAEVVKNGETGFLFNNRSINHITNQIVAIAKTSPEELNVITTNASNYVLETHSIVQLSSNMKSMYHNILYSNIGA